MGQARRKHEAVLAKFPNCIFCGGVEPSETVDHVPARIMFDGKDRPKGLEFPACKVCNNGAKRSDLVAAWISRACPNVSNETQKNDIYKILSALKNNFPELLEEMKMGRGAEKLAMRRLPYQVTRGETEGLLRVGDLVNAHMQVFTLKLALGLHFEITGKPLQCNAAMIARWYSNYQVYTGDYPNQLEDWLGPVKTLSQGKKHVGDQFVYSWYKTIDNSMMMIFAEFRNSFKVVCFTAENANDVPNDYVQKIFSPRQVKELIQSLAN